ncbi:Protein DETOXIFICATION 47 [Mactra antiquata]
MERNTTQRNWNLIGHSQYPHQIAPRSGHNMESNNFIAQPSSTGIQCVETDSAQSIDHLCNEVVTGNGVQSGFSVDHRNIPPDHLQLSIESLSLDERESFIPNNNLSGISRIGVQSASGFSDYGMNIPPDNHLRELPIVRPEIAYEERPLLPSRDSSSDTFCQSEPKEILDGMLYHLNDDDRVRRYKITIQRLLDAKVTYKEILEVVVKNGLSCLKSRSDFYKIYDSNDQTTEPSYVPKSPPRSLSDNEFATAHSTSMSPRDSTIVGNPKYPHYADRNTRFGSFADWKGPSPTPKQLCDANLFYTGEGDKCRCFYCGVTLMKWEEGDDPVDEHYKYGQQCPYAMPKMTEKNSAAAEMIRGQCTPPVAGNRHNHRICQVCRRREIGVSQFDCGHIVCVQCAPVVVDGEKKICQILGCGREVKMTTPYDNAAL